MSINKNNRELLVVINLTDFGQAEWQWLYQWLDANAESYTNMAMAPFYYRITILKGKAATREGFIKQVELLAQRPNVKALDVILHLHGGKRKLWFADGSVSTKTLRDNLKAKKLKNRLRLLYSVACYGETHAQDFVDAGFRTASGARGVNANSTYDYPTQLGMWCAGSYYKTCVQHANHAGMLMTHDGMARANGFPDANSEKHIRGLQHLRIISNAS